MTAVRRRGTGRTQRIIIYRAADADSQVALNRLTAGIAVREPRAAELSPPS
ncbi:hypothetical protein [Nocardia bhagyanarayanae]|uniref:hypothetical protein n=1 Tax=Nocardia bhagyanarayanae TaxID=1215925 RepID=UPI00163AAE34|nr:hypothetical protein [Nocardia bhagyanarayanae]